MCPRESAPVLTKHSHIRLHSNTEQHRLDTDNKPDQHVEYTAQQREPK